MPMEAMAELIQLVVQAVQAVVLVDGPMAPVGQTAAMADQQILTPEAPDKARLRVNLAKAAVRCTVAVAAVEQINTIVQRSFVAALVVPAEAEKVRVTVKLVLMALQTLVAVQVAQGKIVEVLP